MKITSNITPQNNNRIKRHNFTLNVDVYPTSRGSNINAKINIIYKYEELNDMTPATIELDSQRRRNIILVIIPLL